MSTTTSLSVIATTRPTTIWSDSTSESEPSTISMRSASLLAPSPERPPRLSSSSVTVRPMSLPV